MGAVHGTIAGDDIQGKFDLLICLPETTVSVVLQFFDHASVHNEVMRMRLVCKAWLRILDSEAVWRLLCVLQWKHLTARGPKPRFLCRFGLTQQCRPWKDIWRQLEQGSRLSHRVTQTPRGYVRAEPDAFNAAVQYLASLELVEDSDEGIAAFINGTEKISRAAAGKYLMRDRPDALTAYVELQMFTGKSLADAMRTFFHHVAFMIPGESALSIGPFLRGLGQRGCPDATPGRCVDCMLNSVTHFLSNIADAPWIGPVLNMIVDKFMRSNKGIPEEARRGLQIVGYSLLMLSVDLFSPQVNIKMTRSQYVTNMRGVGLPDAVSFHDGSNGRDSLFNFSDDAFGRLYDNVHTWGHVAEARKARRFADALDKIL